MLNFKNLGKILFNILKVIVCSFLTLLSFICMIALYQIYTEKDGFNRGMALIFLIVFSVFLLITMCNLLKTFLTFCSKKVNISEKLFERKYFKSLDKFELVLKTILKVMLRLLAYFFVFLLIAVNIVSVADEKARDRGTFPLEAVQFLTIIALIAMLIMLFKDLKKIYLFLSEKYKVLLTFNEKVKEKSIKLKSQIKENFKKFRDKKYSFKDFIAKFKIVFISKNINKLTDFLENKTNFLKEKFFGERYDIFLNQKSEKFLIGAYQFLSALSLLAFLAIFIPISGILIYKTLVFLFYLFGIMLTLLIGAIASFPYILFLFFL
ncbi:hypothetical protein [Fusobacterium periodonticum]|uniref:hypothetical protein n=1 Tax=Fusobacterium periodonticum TaxID=860 RepID=UPI0028D4C6B3|nr:hypothetical protein [Fusobacterium periodonticum]